MKNWVNSTHCKSGVHCHACMFDNKWKASLIESYDDVGSDFKCPFSEEVRNQRQQRASEEKKVQIARMKVESERLLRQQVNVFNEMQNISYKIGNNNNVYVVWRSVNNGIYTIEYAHMVDNLWQHAGSIFRTPNKILLTDEALIINPNIMVAFVEENEKSSEVHILSLENGKVLNNDVFNLKDHALQVSLSSHYRNYDDYDMPICSSSSSSSLFDSSSSSFQSEFSGLDIETGTELGIYLFSVGAVGKVSCHLYNPISGELMEHDSSSTSLRTLLKNTCVSSCGDYFDFVYVEENKIHYNFFDFTDMQWAYGSCPVLVKSAPYGDSLGEVIDVSIGTYFDKGIGKMSIAWFSKSQAGMSLMGCITTSTGKEWPLDLSNHIITTIPIYRIEENKWGSIAVVDGTNIPKIIVFGKGVRMLSLVKEGTWKAEDLSIEGWIGYVKNRKSQAYLWNNTIHVVFRDDSGVYYFSDKENQLHKLSD